VAAAIEGADAEVGCVGQPPSAVQPGNYPWRDEIC
jgi:hypothetical protein